MLDILIKNGTIVDGTGSARRQGDIGIRDGRIVAIGDVDEPTRRTVDAEGQIVCPGFLDIHTHYDAQVFWDPTVTPSSQHGVTTVMAGNCGFSIAPLSPETADYTMRMLARVEGMPLSALQAGVPWDWGSTEDFLQRLDQQLAINAGFMVGHSAIRRVVMGEASIGHQATDDQLAAMVTLLRQGLAAGGMGFSTSRGRSHQDADGNPVPSRHASIEEFVTLARVCAEFEGTSLECVPSSADFTEEERDLFATMSAEAGRPLNWNALHVHAATLKDDLGSLEVGDRAARRGGKVVALTMPVAFPARYCFLTPFILDSFPGWAKPMAMPVDERLAVLGDPARRRELDAGAQSLPSRFGHADWAAKRIEQTFSEETKKYEGRLVSEIAATERKDPFDALLDIVCVDRLRTTFSRVLAPSTAADWEARRQVWRDPRTLIGASDAGAHVDFTANFNYPTRMLGELVRDGNVLELEEAVEMITSKPADLYGIRDRGRLVEGHHADIVIFDEATIGSEPVITQFDLPGGAGRLYAGSVGIKSVFVNGAEIYKDNVLTDARPGKILHSGRDTRTPSLTS